ncbi:hypothetical protein GCM10009550_42120 [Actinocorallia libanotica]|uniref:MOSC domain-containing protein n=1 Tax=Actinocorallia libanotica TaxID=46162 RepID=A0ABP4BWZ2_9ACTN
MRVAGGSSSDVQNIGRRPSRVASGLGIEDETAADLGARMVCRPSGIVVDRLELLMGEAGLWSHPSEGTGDLWQRQLFGQLASAVPTQPSAAVAMAGQRHRVTADPAGVLFTAVDVQEQPSTLKTVEEIRDTGGLRGAGMCGLPKNSLRSPDGEVRSGDRMFIRPARILSG